MAQIKSNDIIQEENKRVNPINPLPRDLAQSGITDGNSPVPTIKTETKIEESTAPNQVDPARIPEAPAVLSVKSQTVRFTSDGTSVIDLVLVVQDVADAVEYDVRVTKDAGSV